MTNKNTPVNTKPRVEFKNINAFTDLTTYRLPLAGIVSITHRITGFILFVSMPFWVWLFTKSVSSAESFAEFENFYRHGLFFLPPLLVKLGSVLLLFACAHYIFAGLRHVLLEITHKTTKEFGFKSALATFACSCSVTLLFALYLFLG